MMRNRTDIPQSKGDNNPQTDLYCVSFPDVEIITYGTKLEDGRIELQHVEGTHSVGAEIPQSEVAYYFRLIREREVIRGNRTGVLSLHEVINESRQAAKGRDTWRPAQPVMVRDGAEQALEIVNVFDERITKVVQACDSVSELQTHLLLTAWVRNISYEKNVWIDLHLFDADDHLVGADTLTLHHLGPAGGGGDLFGLDQVIFKGSCVPASARQRADVRKVQFRLYYEVNGRAFTDGILHQNTVPADAHISRAAAATRDTKRRYG
jgi:hypothetical protein